MRTLAVLLAASASLGGCLPAPPLLPDGCWYSSEGVAVLHVSGSDGLVLLPGNVRRVRLEARRSWRGAYVEVDPAFNLDTATVGHPPFVRAEAFSPRRSSRFKLHRGSPAGPAIRVPMLAYGEEELRHGPPCPGAVQRAR